MWGAVGVFVSLAGVALALAVTLGGWVQGPWGLRPEAEHGKGTGLVPFLEDKGWAGMGWSRSAASKTEEGEEAEGKSLERRAPGEVVGGYELLSMLRELPGSTLASRAAIPDPSPPGGTAAVVRNWWTGGRGGSESSGEALLARWRQGRATDLASSSGELVEAMRLSVARVSSVVSWDGVVGVSGKGGGGPPPRGGVRTATGGWVLEESIGRGHYGEVWSAEKLLVAGTEGTAGAEPGPENDEAFVMKRILVARGEHLALMAERESYFGTLLSASAGVRAAGGPSPHLARFVEAFEVPGGPQGPEAWLVFRNEGVSLRSLLYDASPQDSGKDSPLVVRPSAFWLASRTSAEGGGVRREIMRQLLMGLAELHAAGVAHRDVKPDNLLVRRGDPGSDEPIACRLADFGSAIDAHTLAHLFPEGGPSLADLTEEYAPPEFRLVKKFAYNPELPFAQDVWSAGVVLMELLMGTPRVFNIDDRARAVIAEEIRRSSSGASWTEMKWPNRKRDMEDLERATLLQAFVDAGLFEGLHDLPVSLSEPHGKRRDRLAKYIQKWDPLGEASHDPDEIDVILALLAWHPRERVSATEALAMPYFHSHSHPRPRPV